MVAPAAAVTTHIPNDGGDCSVCADIPRGVAPDAIVLDCAFCKGFGVGVDDVCNVCGGSGRRVERRCGVLEGGTTCRAEVLRITAWTVTGARAQKAGYGCALGHRWWRHHRLVKSAEADGTYFRDHWTWERA